MPIIDSNLIAFDVAAASKEDAVRLAGGMLVKAGRVLPPYVDSMLEKEISDNCTYLGEGVAMPHSMESGRAHILQAGLCMLRLAQGVPWGDDGEDAGWCSPSPPRTRNTNR
jgi:mannitol/fructose-specific phosphotransferase system IIA component